MMMARVVGPLGAVPGEPVGHVKVMPEAAPRLTWIAEAVEEPTVDAKKYFRLTPADLLEHPIWVLAMDVATFSDTEEDDLDDDTGLVVPLPSDPGLVEQLFENCICYARARFVAANGRSFVGMMKCWGGEGVQGTHPTLVTDGGQVDFYWGIAKPSAEQIGAVYERLGASPGDLFPMTYQPDVPLPDGPSGGDLEGFYYRELRGEDDEVKFVR